MNKLCIWCNVEDAHEDCGFQFCSKACLEAAEDEAMVDWTAKVRSKGRKGRRLGTKTDLIKGIQQKANYSRKKLN